MTVKEFNAIGRATYEAAVKIPEVAERIASDGQVMIYSIREGQKRAIWCVTRASQINHETLRADGFTDNADVDRMMWVIRQTKCAYFD